MNLKVGACGDVGVPPGNSLNRRGRKTSSRRRSVKALFFCNFSFWLWKKKSLLKTKNIKKSIKGSIIKKTADHGAAMNFKFGACGDVGVPPGNSLNRRVFQTSSRRRSAKHFPLLRSFLRLKRKVNIKISVITKIKLFNSP